MLPFKLGVLLTVVAIVAACGDRNTFCPLVVAPAIEVKVMDAVTRESLTAIASGIVTNGQRSDSLRVCQRNQQGQAVTRCAMYGLSGSFYVTVEVPGYQRWDSTGVVVPFGGCGNGTTHLNVGMRRPAA